VCSSDLAKKLYAPEHRVFFFPWDFSWAVGGALARLHPQKLIQTADLELATFEVKLTQ
jgi:hypothetical protein